MALPEDIDIAIVGAGPAGMAAAIAAARHKRVAVLDEGLFPGGQAYRNLAQNVAQRPREAALFGPDYGKGMPLIEAFHASSANYLPQSTVWNIDPVERLIHYTHESAARVLRAQAIVLATGAQERPMPFPGWTLPGVMSAGGLQLLMKSASVVPTEPMILAGSGPLLLLLANQLLDRDCQIAAIVLAGGERDPLRIAAALPRALGAPAYLVKGMRLATRLRTARIPIFASAGGLAAEGRGSFEALRFESGGRSHSIRGAQLVLHDGVIPNTRLSRMARLPHCWSDDQHCWAPVRDEFCASPQSGFFIAGDGGGIEGADAAQASGTVAGYASLRLLGATLNEGERALGHAQKERTRHRRVRPFLDHLYPPRPLADLPDSAFVCRCWEIDAGCIRAAVRAKCRTADEIKAETRAGMGLCQGAMCGSTVQELLAALGFPGDPGFTVRSPARPITVEALAALGDPVEAQR